jgi:hypothetical protein
MQGLVPCSTVVTSTHSDQAPLQYIANGEWVAISTHIEGYPSGGSVEYASYVYFDGTLLHVGGDREVKYNEAAFYAVLREEAEQLMPSSEQQDLALAHCTYWINLLGPDEQYELLVSLWEQEQYQLVAGTASIAQWWRWVHKAGGPY